MEASSSLFVVSLPRSLSTQIHAYACRALQLQSPQWVGAGEVLNFDRVALLDFSQAAPKFTTREVFPLRFEAALHFLDDLIQPYGCAYKDVVQPFVSSHWLRSSRGSELRVLKIRRDPAEVAAAMLARGWDFPRWGSRLHGSSREAVVDGLERAARSLAAVPGVSLDFSAVLTNPRCVTEAICELYPELASSVLHGRKPFRVLPRPHLKEDAR